MVGHNGVDDGQNGDLRIVGENQAVIVALSNVTPPRQAGQLASWPSLSRTGSEWSRSPEFFGESPQRT
jgi:hypothetical protein